MDNVKRFKELMGKIKRDGMDELMKFIDKSDFYIAPASTRFHSCHEHGLLEHSLNVYDCLKMKLEQEPWKSKVAYSEETIILVSLMHDLCKTYFYEKDFKNKKVYKENGSKQDEKGRFDWEVVPCYIINDKMPLGHGSKSVILLQKYIDLFPEEVYAINYHMGWSMAKEEYNSLGAAMSKYPLVLALHEADQEATYLFESEE